MNCRSLKIFEKMKIIYKNKEPNKALKNNFVKEMKIFLMSFVSKRRWCKLSWEDKNTINNFFISPQGCQGIFCNHQLIVFKAWNVDNFLTKWMKIYHFSLSLFLHDYFLTQPFLSLSFRTSVKIKTNFKDVKLKPTFEANFFSSHMCYFISNLTL